jgi:hypothetical protein
VVHCRRGVQARPAPGGPWLVMIMMMMMMMMMMMLEQKEVMATREDMERAIVEGAVERRSEEAKHVSTAEYAREPSGNLRESRGISHAHPQLEDVT